jgi:hypothetical protein
VKVGLAPLKTEGTTFPERAFAPRQAADGVILGPVSHNDYPPADKGGINPSGALRKRLDLFANIRPAKTRAQFPAALRQAGRSRDRAREHGRLLRRPQHVSRFGELMPTPDLALSRAQDHARRVDAHRRGSLPPGAAAAAQAHRRAQGERAARLGRAVSRMRARGRGSAIRSSRTRRRSSMRWRRCWCATRASST